MNLQETTILKIKFKRFYEYEKNMFIKNKLKNILMALNLIISDLKMEEAEKFFKERISQEEKNIIEDRSLFHDTGIHPSNPERVKQKIEELRAKLPEPQKCSKCPNPLFDAMKSSDEEPYVVDGKPVCRECYFDDLGEFIEKNPIWMPFGSLNEHK